MKKKVLISVTALALVICCAIGGTLAWLSTKTDPVVNTFKVGDIDIELSETTKDYKMVPGNTIAKNPKVTVKSGSEACWLFIKVEESANFYDFMTYKTADGWTALEGVSGVYYREVSAASDDQSFPVLKGDSVTVREAVTKDQLSSVKNENRPTLTFTAYAVQKDNISSASDAWSKLSA